MMNANVSLLVTETLSGICDTGDKVDEDRNLKGKVSLSFSSSCCSLLQLAFGLLRRLSLKPVLHENILVSSQKGCRADGHCIHDVCYLGCSHHFHWFCSFLRLLRRATAAAVVGLIRPSEDDDTATFDQSTKLSRPKGGEFTCGSSGWITAAFSDFYFFFPASPPVDVGRCAIDKLPLFDVHGWLHVDGLCCNS